MRKHLHSPEKSNAQKKTGVFGGTFNPVHFGHLRAAEEVREKLSFDRVVFVPSKHPPLKTTKLANAYDRYEMLKQALRGNRFFDVSDIEYTMRGKSYTVKTIRAMKRDNPGTAFYFILGIDAFLDLPNWWHPEELAGLTNFVIMSRPGFHFIDLTTSPFLNIKEIILRKLDAAESTLHISQLTKSTDVCLLRITPLAISSTEIRDIAGRGSSLKYLLPPRVKSYIISKGLYAS
jgi:nicotinate-nucleotide adenylyltransferase